MSNQTELNVEYQPEPNALEFTSSAESLLAALEINPSTLKDIKPPWKLFAFLSSVLLSHKK